jgi:hypothetical protein
VGRVAALAEESFIPKIVKTRRKRANKKETARNESMLAINTSLITTRLSTYLQDDRM